MIWKNRLGLEYARQALTLLYNCLFALVVKFVFQGSPVPLLQIGTNLLGTMFTCQAAMKTMLRARRGTKFVDVPDVNELT